METITIPKAKFEMMQQEIAMLRNSKLYKRLLEFERRILIGEKYTRADLGF